MSTCDIVYPCFIMRCTWYTPLCSEVSRQAPSLDAPCLLPPFVAVVSVGPPSPPSGQWWTEWHWQLAVCGGSTSLSLDPVQRERGNEYRILYWIKCLCLLFKNSLYNVLMFFARSLWTVMLCSWASSLTNTNLQSFVLDLQYNIQYFLFLSAPGSPTLFHA